MELQLENALNELKINELLKGLDHLPAYKLANEFRKIKNVIEEEAKKIILGALEYLCMNCNNIENIKFGENHSEICNLFTKEISKIDNNVLKGIMGEMLFKLENNYSVLELTVESYISSFEKTFSTEHWTPCFSYIEKALNISKLLGKKNNKKNECLEKMYLKLKDSYQGDKLYLSSEIINLLVAEKYGDSSELYNICIDRANEAEIDHEFRKSRVYLELCTKPYITNDDEKKLSIRKRIVNTYEEEAKYTLEKDGTNYFVAAHYIEGAIDANRRIPNNKEKTEELLKLMMHYQQESVKHMKAIPYKVDISKEMSDIISSNLDLFKGKKNNMY